MKKFFYAISIIIYVILIGILYKNYSISNQEYYFKFHKISSVYIAIILGVKFVTDLLYFLKKDNKVFSKISNIYIFVLMILWIFFIPNPKNEENLLNDNLSVMLEVNQKVFHAFHRNKDKLPDDDFFKKLLKTKFAKTPYLKKGDKEYPYRLNLRFSDYPIISSKNFAPGTFFLVVSKKHNDFYITGNILDPITKKLSMLAVSGEIVVLNKNINIDDIKQTNRSMRFMRNVRANTRK